MDLMRIANILVEKIKRDYADDIAVMCLCGSYVRHGTYEKSDLDFYFIPKTPRGYKMAKTFIIEDIGFDLWALPWERAENIAHYQERIVSIIADAQVVYYSTDEDYEKFSKLQSIARQPEGIINFVTRVEALLNESYAAYFSILENRDDFSNTKQHALQLLHILIEAIAVANHTYIQRGWGYILQEVLAMENVPEGFESLCNEILYADNNQVIANKAFELIQSVKKAVVKINTEPVNVKKTFKMFFEEEKAIYNKLYHACDTGDALTAIMAGVSIQYEITRCIGIQAYQQAGLIDIVTCFLKNDLPGYKNTVMNHEKQFEDYLVDNKVPVCRFNTINDFENETMKMD